MELEEAAGIWGVAESVCRGGSGVVGGGDGLGGCGKDAGGVSAGEGCWCRSGNQLCDGGEVRKDRGVLVAWEVQKWGRWWCEGDRTLLGDVWGQWKMRGAKG